MSNPNSAKNIAGQTFGRVTVLARAGSNARGDALWDCSCACGMVWTTVGDSLRRGKTTSCGGCRTAEDRFFSKVREADDCWEWAGSRIPAGYGNFGTGGRGKTCLAHRWAYEFMIGEIPEGLVLDHLCNNKGCVKPYHLDPVTQQVNTQRAHERVRSPHLQSSEG